MVEEENGSWTARVSNATYSVSKYQKRKNEKSVSCESTRVRSETSFRVGILGLEIKKIYKIEFIFINTIILNIQICINLKLFLYIYLIFNDDAYDYWSW